MKLRFLEGIMGIELVKVREHELRELHLIQKECFVELLEKYQDFDTNPAMETLERITDKFHQASTIYYFIEYNSQKVGAIRIILGDKSLRISPMFILPEFQNRKLGQKAIYKLEAIYNNIEHWTLDTILQETKLCQFYEKLGYIQTGDVENLKDGMDIVFYRKQKNLSII